MTAAPTVIDSIANKVKYSFSPHLELHINIILSYLYWLLLLPQRIFEKILRLKKHRILAGLIHFSRLKLAFFKKVAFLPTQIYPEDKIIKRITILVLFSDCVALFVFYKLDMQT